MQITFYVNNSDARVVNKSIVQKEIINGIFKIGTSILTPTVIIEYNINRLKYNYCFINGRYYYITNMYIDNANKLVISCRVDVLMSYKDIICNTDFLIKRASNKRSKYIIDENVTIYNHKTYIADKLENSPFLGVNSDNYILIINGGITDELE